MQQVDPPYGTEFWRSLHAELELKEYIGKMWLFDWLSRLLPELWSLNVIFMYFVLMTSKYLSQFG